MNASRFNPVLREMYQRLIAARKPPKVAFIAIARKLQGDWVQRRTGSAEPEGPSFYE